ncbi:RDD family protein [Nonlabens sp.]|uniref:RDD family protein n=1 Tax=Nonlabens sp. TaxID=1888209 RepID=UPI003F6A3D3C
MRPLIIRRAIAWYIDYCIAGIFTFSVSYILGIEIRLGNIENYINLALLQFVCFIVYNLLAELFFKKTIAKNG